jgi:hypothetical protein
MKTTVELPDDLFRKAKAAAALRGRKLKDLIEDGLRRVLESPEEDRPAHARPRTLHDLMKEYCGIVETGSSDLATNPDHMEDFGRASMGDR